MCCSVKCIETVTVSFFNKSSKTNTFPWGAHRGRCADRKLPFCIKVYVILMCLLKRCLCCFTFQYLLTKHPTGVAPWQGQRQLIRLRIYRKGYINLYSFYVVIKLKARSLFLCHVFPHVLNICISREPVKREDASWCGHKNEPRENPTENGAKILFSAVRNEIFR